MKIVFKKNSFLTKKIPREKNKSRGVCKILRFFSKTSFAHITIFIYLKIIKLPPPLHTGHVCVGKRHCCYNLLLLQPSNWSLLLNTGVRRIRQLLGRRYDRSCAADRGRSLPLLLSPRSCSYGCTDIPCQCCLKSDLHYLWMRRTGKLFGH